MAEAEIERLIGAARSLVAQRVHQARGAAQEAFCKLARDWEEIAKRRGNEAPRHNLIRFFGFEHSEAAFHSPFLCDLQLARYRERLEAERQRAANQALQAAPSEQQQA